MREHLEFLKVSSAAVKGAAWIFLFWGLFAGIATFMGFVPGYARWSGLMIFGLHALAFFLLYLIAKMAELLSKIINEIHKG